MDILSPAVPLPAAIKQRAAALISTTSCSNWLSVLDFEFEKGIHSYEQNTERTAFSRDIAETLEALRLFFLKPSQKLAWEASPLWEQVAYLLNRASVLTEPLLDHTKTLSSKGQFRH